MVGRGKVPNILSHEKPDKGQGIYLCFLRQPCSQEIRVTPPGCIPKCQTGPWFPRDLLSTLHHFPVDFSP